MQITLRDPLGNSIDVSASETEVVPLQNCAKKHLLANATTHKNEYFVNDVFGVFAEFVALSKKPD